MNLAAQLARHLREVHFGGNWTSVNLKEQLAGVTWQQATTRVDSLNTIAALVYHANYYVAAVLKLLQQQNLMASDKYSFSHPPITSAEDWQGLLDKTWADATDRPDSPDRQPRTWPASHARSCARPRTGPPHP